MIIIFNGRGVVWDRERKLYDCHHYKNVYISPNNNIEFYYKQESVREKHASLWHTSIWCISNVISLKKCNNVAHFKILVYNLDFHDANLLTLLERHTLRASVSLFLFKYSNVFFL